MLEKRYCTHVSRRTTLMSRTQRPLEEVDRMTNVLVIKGDDYPFGAYANSVHEAIGNATGLTSTLAPDVSILGSRELTGFDVLVYGGRLTQRKTADDGSVTWHTYLSEDEEGGLLSFVREGKGLVALHYISYTLP